MVTTMKLTTRFQPLAAMALALALAGCGDKSSSSTDTATTTGGTTGTASTTGGTTAKSGGKHVKLAFVTNNVSDYWAVAHKGVDKALAEDSDIEVDFRMPKPPEAADQKTIVDDELTKQVQGIAISPKDAANQTELLNNAASKCLLVTQDSDAPNTNRVCYIGTDNHAAGVKLGGLIKAALPQGGKIALFVGSLDAQNAKDRISGVEDALKGSNVTIIDKRTDEADHAKAKTNAADMMTKNPDIAALVGIWSYNGPAIYSAVQDANKVGKVKILCFDSEDGTLKGLEAGAITATIVQQPFQFGYDCVKKMAQYIRGDKSVFPASKQAIVDTDVLTPDNVKKFEADFAKLTGK